MKERIAVNPAVHFGKPCVAGTRIPVQSVLELVREASLLPKSSATTTPTWSQKTFARAFSTRLTW